MYADFLLRTARHTATLQEPHTNRSKNPQAGSKTNLANSPKLLAQRCRVAHYDTFPFVCLSILQAGALPCIEHSFLETCHVWLSTFVDSCTVSAKPTKALVLQLWAGTATTTKGAEQQRLAAVIETVARLAAVIHLNLSRLWELSEGEKYRRNSTVATIGGFSLSPRDPLLGYES